MATQTFSQLVEAQGLRYELRSLFDDLLTLCLCSFGQKPGAGVSYDENLYLATIGRYPREMARDFFPLATARLVEEMEQRYHDTSGNDVLGEFFERQFARKGSGQFFTPYHLCVAMAEMTCGSAAEKTRHVLDPACGSGRMLLAAARTLGKNHHFFGIDIDHTCVKMTTLNLFLNGIFHGETLWADALLPGDFRMAYRRSFLPFGIFRIADKERSELWHHYSRQPPPAGNSAGRPIQLF